MENLYLTDGRDVTVNGIRGTTVGISVYSSATIKVQMAGTALTVTCPRKDVELYVKPREVKQLFKDHKKSTAEEKLMASLFQAISHESVVKTALDTVSDADKLFFNVINSPATASSKWTLVMPKGLMPNEKVPVLIAHTDLHPNLKHPTKGNLEYQSGQFTSPTGLGADDRAGVFAITQLLPHIGYMPFAVLFPDEEEVGLKGSYEFIKSKEFTELDKHASMYVSIDRRRNKNGSASIATYGINNDALNKTIGTLLNRDVIRGSSTDCRALAAASTHKVPCFNLSCGYDKEHTNNEILYFPELESTVTDLFTLLASPDIVNGTHPATQATSYTKSSYTYESTIFVQNQTFKKADLVDLLDLYLYTNGRPFKANSKTNDIVPDILIGATVRLNPRIMENQTIGGELLTAEMFTTLKTDLWEIENYTNDFKIDLKGITTEISCTNIPFAWLEEVLDDEPQFTT